MKNIPELSRLIWSHHYDMFVQSNNPVYCAGSSSLSYLHSYPSSGLDNSGPQRNHLFVNGVFHVECSGLNDFSTR